MKPERSCSHWALLMVLFSSTACGLLTLRPTSTAVGAMRHAGGGGSRCVFPVPTYSTGRFSKQLWCTDDSGDQRDDHIQTVGVNFVAVFAFLPILSLCFPFLIDRITDFNLSAEERQKFIIGLLLSKRVYLYALALLSLDWCSKSVASERPDKPLGERILSLNAELFSNLGSGSETFIKMDAEVNRELYENLNQVEGKTQALVLPILLAASLAASFAFLSASSAIRGAVPTLAMAVPSDVVMFLQTLPSVAVGFFFGKAELQKFFTSNPTNSLLAASMLTSAAFLSRTGDPLWTMQNALSVLIAVTISRAFALPKLNIIILALSGLALYDFVSVVGSTQFTDNGQSVMEAVARARLVSSPSPADSAVVLAPHLNSFWKPGLLEVVIDGKVTDGLGLGDVIFPSLLGGWSLRFDKSYSNSSTPTFSSALTGYAIASLASEVLAGSGGGQAQLVYIVPCMLAAVFLSLVQQGRLREGLSN